VDPSKWQRCTESLLSYFTIWSGLQISSSRWRITPPAATAMMRGYLAPARPRSAAGASSFARRLSSGQPCRLNQRRIIRIIIRTVDPLRYGPALQVVGRGLASDARLPSTKSCRKLSSRPRGGNAQAPHRCDTTGFGDCVMDGKYTNKSAPQPPRCHSCARPMQLLRRTSRFSFYCLACDEWHVEEGGPIKFTELHA
jgi:hypothetical protein